MIIIKRNKKKTLNQKIYNFKYNLLSQNYLKIYITDREYKKEF